MRGDAHGLVLWRAREVAAKSAVAHPFDRAPLTRRGHDRVAGAQGLDGRVAERGADQRAGGEADLVGADWRRSLIVRCRRRCNNHLTLCRDTDRRKALD